MRTLSLLVIPWLLAACAAPAPLVVGGLQCGPQQYPFNALQDYQRGQVVVRAQVGPDRRLAPLGIEQPTASPYLNAGALAAVRECRAPGLAPGTPLRLVVVYDFSGENEFLPIGHVGVVPLPAQSGP